MGLYPKSFKETNMKVKKFRQHTAVSCPLNVPIGHMILQKKHSAHLPEPGAMLGSFSIISSVPRNIHLRQVPLFPFYLFKVTQLVSI